MRPGCRFTRRGDDAGRLQTARRAAVRRDRQPTDHRLAGRPRSCPTRPTGRRRRAGARARRPAARPSAVVAAARPAHSRERAAAARQPPHSRAQAAGIRSWPQSCARRSPGTPPNAATAPGDRTRRVAARPRLRRARRRAIPRGRNAGTGGAGPTVRRPVDWAARHWPSGCPAFPAATTARRRPPAANSGPAAAVPVAAAVPAAAAAVAVEAPAARAVGRRPAAARDEVRTAARAPAARSCTGAPGKPGREPLAGLLGELLGRLRFEPGPARAQVTAAGAAATVPRARR